MNIIELFENAGIYRTNLREFNPEDIAKIEKQFEIERAQHSNLDSSVASNLILAMNEFPNELLSISNNRILYNLFSKKNYSRNRFSSDNAVSVSLEAVKVFIIRFLSEALTLFIEERMAQNDFEAIEDILMVKEYLPEESLDLLRERVTGKLDFVLDKLDQNFSMGDHNIKSIYFIKFRPFYALLANFKSVDTDMKIRLLQKKITSPILNQEIKSIFTEATIIAMSNYNALNPELDSFLKANREKLTESYETTSSSSDSGMSPWAIVGIIVLVLRVIFFIARLAK
ncbi:hypothetical protein ACHRV5_07150 [Flavobacterium sp. FlaQc-52]|jgi:hypothetical protein|uniref:hypothetical protein n=1 Tax=Flavobacterium sp. FlaQc-52 TaxID=3374185 RepID=UPI0037566E42